MASIDIRRPHRLSPSDAHAVIDQVAARMREKFEVKTQWQGEVLAFERTGISGKIAIGTDEIHVSAQLGMLFSPLKGMIEQEIRRKLDEHFA
ncbi:polyhydroxyalkanoic acid system family protein [Dyella acidiphila]|uniref:Polyhydroxyalkanoic acid system family protein n=1 Tax=Dyella acidiphila TaxID=2775866 RepID=A0ABR9GAE4_9GAMM|nr:polyhydroxyalkanoic acid system family protein [Dyella acidiphila]MBE1161007.1 polyhydroxyalkanoic acid system family protein [Dyella acidiphila]